MNNSETSSLYLIREAGNGGRAKWGMTMVTCRSSEMWNVHLTLWENPIAPPQVWVIWLIWGSLHLILHTLNRPPFSIPHLLLAYIKFRLAARRLAKVAPPERWGLLGGKGKAIQLTAWAEGVERGDGVDVINKTTDVYFNIKLIQTGSHFNIEMHKQRACNVLQLFLCQRWDGARRRGRRKKPAEMVPRNLESTIWMINIYYW